MTKSIFISIMALLCFTIVESSILSNISFLLVVPDLVLICSIYLSLVNGSLYGESMGFVSGLFVDFISGVPLGFNCLYRTIIGYLAGLFSSAIVISGFLMPVISVAIGTIVKTLLIIIISLFYTNIHTSGFLSYNFLFEFVLNILLSPFIFKILNFFRDAISIRNKDIVDNAR